MNSNTTSKSTIILLVLMAFVLGGVFRTAYVAAQTEATSTDVASSTDTPPPAASTNEEPAATPSEAPTPQPTTLTLVHLAGTKYIDYCTDGTTITAYPGDPAIDANFDKPDAPIPHCPDGQTWHHTSGMPGYDTPSSDLEVGQYALVGDTFTAHYPATTYTEATSTVEWPARIVTGLTTDPVTGAAAPTSEPPATEPPPAAATESASSPTPPAEPSNDNSPPAPDTESTSTSTPAS
jgi:hypothetical protein